MRDLPDEHDNFYGIRVNDRVYVDKSIYVKKLLNHRCKFFRMCRPRRFGKSNFLQMLNSYFSGDQKLFDGLAIADRVFQSYPVLYFDFSSMNADTKEDFEADLSHKIHEMAKSYEISITKNETLPIQLEQLIHELSLKEVHNDSVVILIDEYDRPIRRYAECNQAENVELMNYITQNFLQIFEDCIENIKFLFMTCTTQLLSLIHISEPTRPY